MTQGGPAAVHQKLIPMRVVTYDPRQHPHGNIIKTAGANERLLHIYTTDTRGTLYMQMLETLNIQQ